MEQQKQALQVNPSNFKNNAKRYGVVAAAAGAAAGSTGANAAAIDTTAVVATITDGVTTVSAIGLAVLSLVVVIKVFKWARSAM
jgi:hypothetical protein